MYYCQNEKIAMVGTFNQLKNDYSQPIMEGLHHVKNSLR